MSNLSGLNFDNFRVLHALMYNLIGTFILIWTTLFLMDSVKGEDDELKDKTLQGGAVSRWNLKLYCQIFSDNVKAAFVLVFAGLCVRGRRLICNKTLLPLEASSAV